MAQTTSTALLDESYIQSNIQDVLDAVARSSIKEQQATTPAADAAAVQDASTSGRSVSVGARVRQLNLHVSIVQSTTTTTTTLQIMSAACLDAGVARLAGWMQAFWRSHRTTTQPFACSRHASSPWRSS